MDEQNWIADGTAEVEPVTVETPAEVEVEAVAEAIEVAPVEAVEVAEAVAEAEAVQAFIDARLGDDPYQLPEGVRLPQKRGDEVEYVSVQDIIKDGMRGRDYHAKTTELAQMRTGIERERDAFAKREAQMEARAKYLDERDAEIKAALTDPKSARAYEEHLAQYQNNEMYRKNVDSALNQQQTEAELRVLQEREDTRLVSQASEMAIGWVENLATEYPGVDTERVRGMYARALSDGSAALDEGSVRAIYQAEAAYVNKTVSPLRSELAELRNTVASLQAAQAAETQNETTQHALKRAKTVPVATGGGAPSTTPVKPTKFTPNELSERNSAWAKQG